MIGSYCVCPFCRIKGWVNQIQKDLITITDSASGLQNLKQVGAFLGLQQTGLDLKQAPHIYLFCLYSLTTHGNGKCFCMRVSFTEISHKPVDRF